MADRVYDGYLERRRRKDIPDGQDCFVGYCSKDLYYFEILGWLSNEGDKRINEKVFIEGKKKIISDCIRKFSNGELLIFELQLFNDFDTTSVRCCFPIASKAVAMRLKDYINSGFPTIVPELQNLVQPGDAAVIRAREIYDNRYQNISSASSASGGGRTVTSSSGTSGSNAATTNPYNKSNSNGNHYNSSNNTTYTNTNTNTSTANIAPYHHAPTGNAPVHAAPPSHYPKSNYPLASTNSSASIYATSQSHYPQQSNLPPVSPARNAPFPGAYQSHYQNLNPPPASSTLDSLDGPFKAAKANIDAQYAATASTATATATATPAVVVASSSTSIALTTTAEPVEEWILIKEALGDICEDKDDNDAKIPYVNAAAQAFAIEGKKVKDNIVAIQAAIAPWKTHKAAIAKELNVNASAPIVVFYRKALKDKLIKKPINVPGWAVFKDFKERYEEEYEELK